MASTGKLTDRTVGVDLGGRLVAVPEGGLYGRFRMNTGLDEVARDPRVSSVDFFRRMPKTRVDSRIGPVLTPNFYYRIATTRLTMLAPSKAIRARRTVGADPDPGVQDTVGTGRPMITRNDGLHLAIRPPQEGRSANDQTRPPRRHQRRPLR